MNQSSWYLRKARCRHGLGLSWVEEEIARVNGKARPRHVSKLTWLDEERTEEAMGRNDTAIGQTKRGKNKRIIGRNDMVIS